MGSWSIPICSAGVGSLQGASDTSWLVLTNVALGLAVLAACLWVAWGVVLEGLSRQRSQRAAAVVGAVRAHSPARGADAGDVSR
jgi:hypothetical protein